MSVRDYKKAHMIYYAFILVFFTFSAIDNFIYCHFIRMIGCCVAVALDILGIILLFHDDSLTEHK